MPIICGACSAASDALFGFCTNATIFSNLLSGHRRATWSSIAFCIDSLLSVCVHLVKWQEVLGDSHWSSRSRRWAEWKTRLNRRLGRVEDHTESCVWCSWWLETSIWIRWTRRTTNRRVLLTCCPQWLRKLKTPSERELLLTRRQAWGSTKFRWPVLWPDLAGPLLRNNSSCPGAVGRCVIVECILNIFKYFQTHPLVSFGEKFSQRTLEESSLTNLAKWKARFFSLVHPSADRQTPYREFLFQKSSRSLR